MNLTEMASSSVEDSSTLSLVSLLPMSFTRSSTLRVNLNGFSHSYFTKEALGQWRSTRATWEGSMALKDSPSVPASKVASSTSVLIAEATAFHSTELAVLRNSNVPCSPLDRLRGSVNKV